MSNLEELHRRVEAARQALNAHSREVGARQTEEETARLSLEARLAGAWGTLRSAIAQSDHDAVSRAEDSLEDAKAALDRFSRRAALRREAVQETDALRRAELEGTLRTASRALWDEQCAVHNEVERRAKVALQAYEAAIRDLFASYRECVRVATSHGLTTSFKTRPGRPRQIDYESPDWEELIRRYGPIMGIAYPIT